jgi:hypothetical protein
MLLLARPVVAALLVLGATLPVPADARYDATSDARSGVHASAVDPGAPHPIVGMVVEQGFERPIPDAVVTLYRDAGGEPEPVATALTDEEGVFVFEVDAPGPWRVAAELGGLSSPLSPPIHVGQEGVEPELHRLVLPSLLMMLAASCELEDGVAVVVGEVRDLDFDIPIPGARVEARWLDPALGEREQLAQTDASGRYRICGVTAPSELRLRAELLGRAGGWVPVTVPRPAVVVHDLVFSLATSTAEAAEEIDGSTPAPSPDFGDLAGVLLDAGSGAPVHNAVIQVRGTPFQGVTGMDGSFDFPDLRPGRYVLEVRHLGYALEARAVELPEGRNIHVTLRVAPSVLELAEVEVVARTAREEMIRTTPFRRYVLSGEDLAEAEERGARLADLLRSRMSGLRVSEVSGATGALLCVETSRRIARLQPPDSIVRATGNLELGSATPCAMVQVVVDGARVGGSDANQTSDFLRSLSVHDLESVEFFPPSHATLTWGMGGNVANGALVIHTRGKGPYRSAARDVAHGSGGTPGGEQRGGGGDDRDEGGPGR